MGQVEARIFADQVIVKNYVQVQGPGAPLLTRLTAGGLFQGLELAEAFPGQEAGIKEDGTV